jgi:maltose/moltooligosaccharide transporter
MIKKPNLSFWQIWNMSFGFLGIQFGFALQNANASRILQTFGADVEHLSWFWLAAPLTGLIVQPIIGHYSDRTWGRLGRRRPYFLTGAIIASIALSLLPNAGYFARVIPAMFVGAGFLMLMDASINVSMEPFRALVADMLPARQRTLGYSIQTVLIGIGAIVGSWLPYILANWLGISSESAFEGDVPDNVVFAFYIGSVVFILTIIWTVVRTKEYSPEELNSFSEGGEEIASGPSRGILQIFSDFAGMPKAMRQLGAVQFFSWFALFSMWVFTTPAVAQHVYGLPVNDTSSKTYQEAGNWVGIIFGVYNGVAAVFAMLLPIVSRWTSRKTTHSIALAFGAIGMFSIYFVNDPRWLILSMVFIGIAWASILAMPYAILAGSIPPRKMGIYMGIFNFFIVFPQIVNGIFGGPIVKRLYDSQAIYALLGAGISFVIAAVVIHFVEDKEDIKMALNEN